MPPEGEAAKVEVTIETPKPEPTPAPAPAPVSPPAPATPISEEELRQLTELTERLTRAEETLKRVPSQEEVDWLSRQVMQVQSEQFEQKIAAEEKAAEEEPPAETIEEIPVPPVITMQEPEPVEARRPWWVRLLV